MALLRNGDGDDNVIVEDRHTYSEAVEKLKSPQTAQEGMNELRVLSQDGNYDATYLLSRLKFDAKTKKSMIIFRTLFGHCNFHYRSNPTIKRLISC